MRKAILTSVMVTLIGGGGYAYYRYRGVPVKPTVVTASVNRGAITDQVNATGTLQAVTTVQVGTQVSGTIQSLNADFNSLVRKGQVIARLDPSLFQTQIEQARANLIRAEADVERLKVALEDALTKAQRARELTARQLLPKSDLDAAEVAVRSAEAQVRSAEAQVTQARASLNQNEVNLKHTVITAPIDGLVISRNVDVGQTVAASMQAPTLFVLAADLTEMQVVANLDESDVGRIRPGQPVQFQVDAFPNEPFFGTVAQVRLQPIVQQNVVTYATVIDVPNPDLKLKPGMTANVSIEIARRQDVLRVPNAALRFRPSTEVFAAFGQEPPTAGGTRNAGSASPGASSAPAATATGVTADANAGTASVRGSSGTSAALGNSSNGPARRQAVGTSGTAVTTSTRADSTSLNGREPQARTIDALFGPLPTVESTGRVWLVRDGKLVSARVRLGVTDGQTTELLEADGIGEGTELVTNITLGGGARTTTTALPPFIAQPGGRFGGPGAGNRGTGGGR